MSVVTYNHLALAWTPERERDTFFNRLTIFVIICAVIFAAVMSSIEIPKTESKEKTVIPERIAKFILQKEKKKVIKKKVVPKPKPRLKIIKRIKKEIKSKKPLTKVQKKARKKAESSGLLALSKELADLMDTSSINAMVGTRVKRNSSALKVATVNKSVLTSGVSKGSGGISREKYVTHVSKTVLSKAEKISFRKSLAFTSTSKLKGKNHSVRKRGDNVRSEEDIVFVMDKNKSKLHSIYRRARRGHPGLKGKIVLAITISPSGKVLKVIIKSSELNDPKLESRLVARIKQFNFGVGNVEPVTVIFPIEFLPS